jgi:hypothetical protein
MFIYLSEWKLILSYLYSLVSIAEFSRMNTEENKLINSYLFAEILNKVILQVCH